MYKVYVCYTVLSYLELLNVNIVDYWYKCQPLFLSPLLYIINKNNYQQSITHFWPSINSLCNFLIPLYSLNLLYSFGIHHSIIFLHFLTSSLLLYSMQAPLLNIAPLFYVILHWSMLLPYSFLHFPPLSLSSSGRFPQLCIPALHSSLASPAIVSSQNQSS